MVELGIVVNGGVTQALCRMGFARSAHFETSKMADTIQVTPVIEGPDATLVKEHQTYFVKSAEKVNSTLHAAICKFCHAQDVEMKDNRTCLWQARDCIRHLARCPHVTEGVRDHFKEEARLLNARLNSKKRTFQDMSSKQENNTEAQYQMSSGDAQPVPPAQLQDNSADASGKKTSLQVSSTTTPNDSLSHFQAPQLHLDHCFSYQKHGVILCPCRGTPNHR